MSGTSAYGQAWQSFKLRRHTVAALFLSYLPAVATVSLIARGVARDVESTSLVTALIWMGLTVAAAVWFSAFRCPRCGKFFTISWTLQNPFARKCLHCGLPVGGQAEPAEPFGQP